MPSITEIQQAILVLPKDEYARLREWLSDLDWERWDKHARLAGSTICKCTAQRHGSGQSLSSCRILFNGWPGGTFAC